MEFPTNPAVNPEQRLRVETLAPSLLLVMGFAILQPIVVITTTVLPLQFGDIQWRVRVFALILGTTPQVAVSLVVVAAIGIFSERYIAVRLAAIAGILLGLVLIPVLVFDALDIVQLRPIVPADQMRNFLINALQTGIMAGVLIPLLLWMGRRGLQAGRDVPAIVIEDHIVIAPVPPPA